MAVFGSLSVLRSQLVRSPVIELALAYASRALDPASAEARRIAAVPVGETLRVELSEGVFALEQAYYSKPAVEGKWESHERYVDFQLLVAGSELMGVIDVSRLTLAEDYRAERDLMFYAPTEGGSTLRIRAGEAAVFFPADAHMPSLADAAPGLVRKTVVKIPVAALAAPAA